MADEQKLQIDDDWKSEAAREKERLAHDVEAEKEQAWPASSFASLVQLLAMQAMVGLGGFSGPGGHQIPPNLEMAKHHIDLLDMLETKTKGNLEADESRLLSVTLHQLRMAYVETMRGGGIPPTGAGPG
jgi:hypothetical protein